MLHNYCHLYHHLDIRLVVTLGPSLAPQQGVLLWVQLLGEEKMRRQLVFVFFPENLSALVQRIGSRASGADSSEHCFPLGLEEKMGTLPDFHSSPKQCFFLLDLQKHAFFVLLACRFWRLSPPPLYFYFSNLHLSCSFLLHWQLPPILTYDLVFHSPPLSSSVLLLHSPVIIHCSVDVDIKEQDQIKNKSD